MKTDKSPEAVTMRLKRVEQLRRLCLSLADTDVGRELRRKHPDNPAVRRIALALGDEVSATSERRTSMAPFPRQP